MWLIAPSLLAAPFDVYMVRHFEKQKGDDPQLTAEGRQRAEGLANLLKDKGLSKIYSTNYRRTLQTALPLSEKTNTAVTHYNPGDLEAFVIQLKEAKEDVLVVGHSNTTPVLFGLLGGATFTMTEADYGELFKVTIDDKKVTTSSRMVSPE